MLHFVILDDDESHNRNTKKRLESIVNELEIEASVVLNTTLPSDVIEYCALNNARDNVYFLDVNIQNEISGIEVGGIIREQDAKAYIVFISGHPEYVLPSLKTKVFDYLIKPVSKETLMACIKNIYKDYVKLKAETTSEILSIKSGFTVHNLMHDEIVYLEKYGHLLVIHTLSGKIESSESLESIGQKLDDQKFFRCHKSYIVNIAFISSVDFPNGKIVLRNGEVCIVSKRSKKELKALWVI